MKVNGRLVTQFEPLDEVLDNTVGGQVKLELERGGKLVSAKLPVGDLHAITPSAYAEFGDAVVHTLSYQQARHFNVPMRGVYVANPGYVFAAAGIPRGAVITTMNSQADRHAEGLRDGHRAARGRRSRHGALRHDRRSQQHPICARMRMDRLWFPAHHCERDDSLGRVALQGSAAGTEAEARQVSAATFPKYKDARLKALAPSLVMVTFDMPYSVSGITERNYHGTGRHRRRAARPGGRRPQHRAGRRR